ERRRRAGRDEREAGEEGAHGRLVPDSSISCVPRSATVRRGEVVRILVAIVVTLLFASAVSASRDGGPGVPELSRKSRSIGYPFDGRLEHGVLLRETPFVRYTPEYARDGRFYGTWELVQLLHRAAHRVATRVPGARLSVGELSKQGGGRVPGHHSHQNGRDVD